MTSIEMTPIAVCDVAGRLKFTLPDGSIRYGNCPLYIPVGTELYASPTPGRNAAMDAIAAHAATSDAYAFNNVCDTIGAAVKSTKSR